MWMRPLPIALAAIALFLASCGPASRAPVRDGPQLTGSLAAEWTTAAPARQVAFSPDGHLLATSDASGLIAVRETGSWRPVAKFRHEGGATSVAFGADGKTLLSGGYDGNVRVWDLARHAPARLLQGAGKTIWAIDVSPDGTRVAAGGEDSTIRVWTLNRPAAPMVLRGHERNVWEVRFSPDGKLLASGSFDHQARLWDAATGKSVRTLDGHEQAVVGLAFSPDGKLLATCGDDSTIRFWKVADGAPLTTIPVGNHTYKLAFSGDGRWLASGGRARGAIGTFWHQLTGGRSEATPVRIWRASDGGLVTKLPAIDDIAYVAFSPDGHWLAAAEEDDRIRLWRLRERAR
jgi:WD40 repeat protein